MIIGTDTNFSFGKAALDDNALDVTRPVFAKCFTFTDQKARFIHNAEAVSILNADAIMAAVYDSSSSEATAYPMGKCAAASGLTEAAFDLSFEIGSDALKDVAYYHLIIPVLVGSATKFLVIMMNKENEILPSGGQPVYTLADTLANALPESADPPSGGGGSSDFTTATVTISEWHESTKHETVKAIAPILYGPFINDGELVPNVFPNSMEIGTTFSVVLYKNSCYCLGNEAVAEDLFSGNITYDEVTELYEVTGDFNILV